MGDKIQDLPVNSEHKKDNNDMELVNTLFRNKKNTTIFNEFKSSLIGGFLFIILNLKIIDKLIENVGFKSELMKQVIKFCIFVILFYILKNQFI